MSATCAWCQDIAAKRAEQERDEASRRLERSTDWHQQRYNALRKWVKEEVEPLSAEVAHHYFSIVANGSPSPHESADWQNTMHGLTLRAEKAEQDRDEARIEVAKLQIALKSIQAELDLITKDRNRARSEANFGSHMGVTNESK